MRDADLLAIAALTAQGALTGQSEPDILAAFGEALCRRGLPLAQLDVIVDTLHPTHEGHVFKWYRDKAAPQPIEYPPPSGEQLENWRRSPWFHMLQSGESLLRRRLHEQAGREFSALGAHFADGRTDLCRGHQPLLGRRHDRRNGLRLFELDERPRGRLR